MMVIKVSKLRRVDESMRRNSEETFAEINPLRSSHQAARAMFVQTMTQHQKETTCSLRMIHFILIPEIFVSQKEVELFCETERNLLTYFSALKKIYIYS